MRGWHFLHVIAGYSWWRVYNTAGIPAKRDRISSRSTATCNHHHIQNKPQRRGNSWTVLNKFSHMFICTLLKLTFKAVYSVKILTSEQIFFTAVLFSQVLVFCRLINKSMFDLTRSTNLFDSNHLTGFWLRREDQQISIIKQLLYQTDKSSHIRCSIKKAGRKKFAIFIRKHLYWSLL